MIKRHRTTEHTLEESKCITEVNYWECVTGNALKNVKDYQELNIVNMKIDQE